MNSVSSVTVKPSTPALSGPATTVVEVQAKPSIGVDSLKISYRQPISPDNPTSETHISWQAPDGKGLRNPDGYFGSEITTRRTWIRKKWMGNLSKFLNASGEPHQLRLMEGTIRKATPAEVQAGSSLKLDGMFMSNLQGEMVFPSDQADSVIEGQIGIRYGRTATDAAGKTIKAPAELRLPFKATFLEGGFPWKFGIQFPGGDAVLKQLNLEPSTKLEPALATFLHDLRSGLLKLALKEIR